MVWLQEANAPANVDILILDVSASPAGGVAVSTRVTYPDGGTSSAPAVRMDAYEQILLTS